MKSYNQYPIVCTSCQEPIACYADKFLTLAKKIGKEQALNKMGFTLACSRNALLQPNIKFHNTVDLQAIKGVATKRYSSAIGSANDPLRRFRSDEIPEGVAIDDEDSDDEGEFVRPTTIGVPVDTGRLPTIFHDHDYNGLVSSEVGGQCYFAG